jgi:hypothetical protein
MQGTWQQLDFIPEFRMLIQALLDGGFRRRALALVRKLCRLLPVRARLEWPEAEFGARIAALIRCERLYHTLTAYHSAA